MSWGRLSLLPLLVVAVTALVYVLQPNEVPAPPSPPVPEITPPTPDFASISDTAQKKAAFFNFMRLHVRAANDRVLADRERLARLRRQLATPAALGDEDEAWLAAQAARYRAKGASPSEVADALWRHMDIIPASLALAQAAKESAWGSSRFARSGNNYFGIWCFTANCGDVPLDRDEGKTHEVARYDSVTDNVSIYLLTLNRHEAYTRLRDIRANLRESGAPVTGTALVPGLLNYSERREAYVEEVNEMIVTNDLARFDRR